MIDKRKQAAALSYDQQVHEPPRVRALGKGKLADSIIEKAENNNIPIVEDPSLVELLSALNINETIPDELYEAVAEVFAFVYRLDQGNKT